MDSSTRRKPHGRRQRTPRPRSWCCSFTDPPRSPESSVHYSHSKPPPPKPETPSKSASSFPSSPQSTRLGLVGRIDPRRILSPGRVSPITDSEPVDLLQEINVSHPSPIANANSHARSERAAKTPTPEGSLGLTDISKEEEESSLGVFDVRLSLKGKNGGTLVLELNSEVLSGNSSVFADLIADYRKGSCDSAANLCRIEVPEVDNLNVFRETIELMFEEDITKRLLKAGVYRSIGILEVILSWINAFLLETYLAF